MCVKSSKYSRFMHPFIPVYICSWQSRASAAEPPPRLTSRYPPSSWQSALLHSPRNQSLRTCNQSLRNQSPCNQSARTHLAINRLALSSPSIALHSPRNQSPYNQSPRNRLPLASQSIVSHLIASHSSCNQSPCTRNQSSRNQSPRTRNQSPCNQSPRTRLAITSHSPRNQLPRTQSPRTRLAINHLALATNRLATNRLALAINRLALNRLALANSFIRKAVPGDSRCTRGKKSLPRIPEWRHDPKPSCATRRCPGSKKSLCTENLFVFNIYNNICHSNIQTT